MYIHARKTRPDIYTKNYLPHNNYRSQHKNVNMNSQDNMPLPEASNPIGRGPEKSNLAEAEDKDFKIVRNMVKVP